MSPERTCIGCRRRDQQVDLVRVVVSNSAPATAGSVVLAVDAHRALPGRGAWLHRDPACLRRAVKQRAFNRALLVAAAVESDAVQQWFDLHVVVPQH